MTAKTIGPITPPRPVPEFLKRHDAGQVTAELLAWMKSISGRMMELERAVVHPPIWIKDDDGEKRQNHALRQALMRLRMVEERIAFLIPEREEKVLVEMLEATQAVEDAVRQGERT